MGGCNPMMETLEEENLIAAARLLLRALDSNKKITDKARKVLADVSARLTSVMKIAAPKDEDEDEDEQEGGEVTDIRERINLILEKIVTWEGGDSMIWDCDPEDGKEYLKTVDEARRLAESLESLNLSKDETELLRNVNDVIHTSMSRIEEEFRRILVQNMQNFEPERFSFRSNEDDSLDLNSIVSFGDDSIDESVQRDSLSRGGSEVVVMDLVNPQVIPDLITIANLMFDSNYGRECCQAFISARKEALDDCLFVLEIEKLSIEDVLKMEWVSLNSRIRRWTKGMKVFVRVYLASEKFLCEQIFDQIQTDPVSSICFSELSKASMLQLLKFAEAISIGPHQPEKLLKILDIYEVLSDLIPDIDGLYSDENGSCIRTEFQHVLTRVGDCVKVTFIEFENAVGSNTSNSAFPGGGNHHLTRYVMNYIKTLTDYGDSLNACLKDHEQAVDDQDSSSSPDTSPGNDNNDTNNGNSSSSPMALHFRLLMSILEHNLEEKSKLYKDEALRHLFMMNNINYMAEKVKNSELRNILGDNWIRKHNWKFQQHAMSYERATWSSILNLLRQDGLSGSGSSGSSTSRTLLRERLHAFYTAFEDIYKSQTGWSIPNSQLREDVRISMSLKVIQAYRNFVGRHNNNISEKYIKYSADDLENYIMDLFEGAPKSLHSFHRK
ncbi:putative exocyst complex component Exo70, cullin repeat-like-containing domain superfamily [Helianthus annuus]|nr:exocyst complex component EXO70E2 [Helianthus annuus]KAF5766110.1 putative exocyst complex component Exo70, cullin repeat-like-containing domain superfamily [Helianthus annuus]KAJ0452542.1 putative exocyst complex component Exo70, cullin repeat-like-containing domain superfamily [Helianthus annuus]KAJ0457480.1 putative exocyst complex component Exo70, cullin repeat-like-containing domain superfamily [Helianthus annuus]KAJ0474447.1 putative exocyst complex component Exo70, cullin repeat-like-